MLQFDFCRVLAVRTKYVICFCAFGRCSSAIRYRCGNNLSLECATNAIELGILQLHSESEFLVRIVADRILHSLVDGQVAGVVLVDILKLYGLLVLFRISRFIILGNGRLTSGHTGSFASRNHMVAVNNCRTSLFCNRVRAKRQIVEGVSICRVHICACPVELGQVDNLAEVIRTSHRELNPAEILVSRSADYRLLDNQLSCVKGILNRANPSGALVGRDVIIVTNLCRTCSNLGISGVGQVSDFLPEVLHFLAVFEFVHTQNHGRPVVAIVKSNSPIIGRCRRIRICRGSSINLDVGHLNRSGRSDLLVQLNLDTVRTFVALIALVVPNLQHCQAELAGGVGVGNGGLVTCVGNRRINLAVGVGSIFIGQHDALNSVAQSHQRSLVLNPGVGLLHAVHVGGQVVHDAGEGRRHITGSGVVGSVGTSGVALAGRRIREHHTDAGVLVVGVQLHGHGGGPLAVLVGAVVPGLDHLGHSLQGGVGVCGGDGDRGIILAGGGDCHRLRGSEGHASEGIARLSGLSGVLLHGVLARREVPPGHGLTVLDLNPAVDRVHDLTGGGIVVARLVLQGNEEGLAAERAVGLAIVEGDGLGDLQFAELVDVDHIDLGILSDLIVAVVLKVFPFGLVDLKLALVDPADVLHLEIELVLIRSIVHMPDNANLNNLLLGVVAHTGDLVGRSGSGFHDLEGVDASLRDVGHHKLTLVILVQGDLGGLLQGAGHIVLVRLLNSRIINLRSLSNAHGELGVQVEEGIRLAVDQLLHRDFDLNIAVNQLGEEDHADDLVVLSVLSAVVVHGDVLALQGFRGADGVVADHALHANHSVAI